MAAKKLFISQPMAGRSDGEILQQRQEIIDHVRDMYPEDEIKVIDSFFRSASHDASPLWFLGLSLQRLSRADVAYFAEGWDESHRCNIENTCAIEYGIEVIEDYR